MPMDHGDDLMLTWAALLAQSVGWVPPGGRSSAVTEPHKESAPAKHSTAL